MKTWCRRVRYWRNFCPVSEAKILIVRRGALSNGHGHGRSVKELQRNAFDEEGQVLRRVGNRGSLLFTNTWWWWRWSWSSWCQRWCWRGTRGDRNRELNCSLQTLRQGRLSLSKWFYGNNPDSSTASKCNEFNASVFCRYQCNPQLVNYMYPRRCVFMYIQHLKCAMWSIVESFHAKRVFELCSNLCMRSRCGT